MSYRSQQRLRKAVKIGLICLVCVLGLLLILAKYLGRYVVYADGHAYFDFGRDTSRTVEVPATADPAGIALPTVPLETVEAPVRPRNAAEVDGYYIDLAMLQEPAKVLAALKELPEPCTIMIDLKGGNGSFYYSTDIVDATLAKIDIATVDEIIDYMRTNGFSMIARVKAFEDSRYAEQYPNAAIKTQGGSLLVYNRFYWLNPDNDNVVAYLEQIVRDLSARGFREIVFDDFYFPSASQAVYTSEKTRSALMSDIAVSLSTHFSTSGIIISFGDPPKDFAPAASSHVFISDVGGAKVTSVAASFVNLEVPEEQLVFLTASNDTRFDTFQRLRPLRG